MTMDIVPRARKFQITSYQAAAPGKCTEISNFLTLQNTWYRIWINFWKTFSELSAPFRISLIDCPLDACFELYNSYWCYSLDKLFSFKEEFRFRPFFDFVNMEMRSFYEIVIGQNFKLLPDLYGQSRIFLIGKRIEPNKKWRFFFQDLVVRIRIWYHGGSICKIICNELVVTFRSDTPFSFWSNPNAR